VLKLSSNVKECTPLILGTCLYSIVQQNDKKKAALEAAKAV
jgi:hypothetical protein